MLTDHARSLPIRPDPMDGEALDSWLETVSHRLSAAWGDVTQAVGLHAADGRRDFSWLMRLTTGQAATITAATAVPATQLHAMTLSRYDGTGLRLVPGSSVMDRAFPWGRSRFSRYCPSCLAADGGRWQLFWRLGWAFVCETHRCLLLDECPACRQRQRENPIPIDLVANPGHCMRPGASATGRALVRCNADLAGAPTKVFVEGHPVLNAQRLIKQMIQTGHGELAVYGDQKPPAAEALADIRALANRILGHASHADLQQVLPEDLTAAHRGNSGGGVVDATAPRTAKSGPYAPARAVTAAAGVTAALAILTSPDIDSAANRMRSLISSCRDHGRPLTALTTWGRGTTATLTGIQLTALAPRLKPGDQLRHRIGCRLPAVPNRGDRRRATISAKIPHRLWVSWTLRLCPPHMNFQNLAAALSCAVRLVGTRTSVNAATVATNYRGGGQSLSHTLQCLERDSCWEGSRAAIIRLADYLHTHDVPIDYQRRRALDYTSLLTVQRWNRICRDTSTTKGGVGKRNIARCHLYVLLTGNPVDRAPWFNGTNEFIACLTRFPGQLTPELSAALMTEAHVFLKRHNISEPVSWNPPLSLLDGLKLAGTNPESLNIAAPHTLAHQKPQPGQIAAQLDTTPEAVRYALTHHPAPRGH